MDLNIREKFIILTLNPEKGGFLLQNQEIDYGLSAAVLLNLILEEKIEVEGKLIKLKDQKSSHDFVLSEAINMMVKAGKDHKIYYWINRFEFRSTVFKKDTMENLQRKGLVSIENRKFLGFINYKKYYLLDFRLRDSIIKQLRECILFHKNLTNESIALAGLTYALRLQKMIANDRSEIKTMRKENKLILKESPVGESVEKISRQLQIIISGTSEDQSASMFQTVNNMNNVNNF